MQAGRSFQQPCNFDVLYPETISTQVIRLARHVWSDCIHMSDNGEGDEAFVRHLMALYLTFSCLKEDDSYYPPDIEYLADVFVMLQKRYVSGMKDDPSKQMATLLFDRCCHAIATFAVECDLESPKSFES